jgi:hypothetical protein
MKLILLFGFLVASAVSGCAVDEESGTAESELRTASPPPPVSNWGKAVHTYRGTVFSATADGNYAFVKFEDVGFGRFDTRTYKLTESYGDVDGQVANGRWVATTRRVRVPEGTENGSEIEVRDLATPGFSRKTLRKPSPGTGDLAVRLVATCNGQAAWNENEKMFHTLPDGNVVEGRIECSPEVNMVAGMYPNKQRQDLTFDRESGNIRRCVGPCIVVRRMPVGTNWVGFSKSGTWLAYGVGNHVYRELVGGGGLQELPMVAYAVNNRDGKLISSGEVYDIDSERRVRNAIPVNIPSDGASVWCAGPRAYLVNSILFNSETSEQVNPKIRSAIFMEANRIYDPAETLIAHFLKQFYGTMHVWVF